MSKAISALTLACFTVSGNPRQPPPTRPQHHLTIDDSSPGTSPQSFKVLEAGLRPCSIPSASLL